jgi:hypothetical protein
MVRLKAITQAWEAGVTGADQTRMVKRAEAMGYDMIAIPSISPSPRNTSNFPVRSTFSRRSRRPASREPPRRSG